MHNLSGKFWKFHSKNFDFWNFLKTNVIFSPENDLQTRLLEAELEQELSRSGRYVSSAVSRIFSDVLLEHEPVF